MLSMEGFFMKNKKRIYYICMFALFAAVMTVCSQIYFPLPFTAVPVNLGLFGVAITGGILGKWGGSASIGIYVLMGLVGLPVFAKFNGGPSALFGATGGYIFGYIIAAFIIGFFVQKFKNKWYFNVLGMVLGFSMCYLFGTLWYMGISKTPLIPALMGCVVPFLPGDALKIALATVIIGKLRKILPDYAK